MAEKHCNHCGNENQDSFAMELLKGYSAQAKRWFIACLVILAMWLATIGGFVWYLYQYDFESYETIVEQDASEIQLTTEYREAIDIFPALHKYQNEHTAHNLQNLCVEIADFCKSVYASTQSESERKIFHSVLDKIQTL